jgi:shikimate dehydrogenase
MIVQHPKACVIGWPISHSRSPLIHGYWLKHYGLSGSYVRQAVEPANLESFFTFLRAGEYAGCNVTRPHKQSAVLLVDEPDARVQRIGALNTVWREGEKLHATSTDGPGFATNIVSALPDYQFSSGPVVVLGAGGSARAIIDEMIRQGATDVHVFNRTTARAEELQLLFGKAVRTVDHQDLPKSLGQASLLVNTTSAGVGNSDTLSISWEALASKAIVTDLSYVPLITPFLAEARERGHPIVPGLGMLLHQAVLGFEKWFGVTPEVTPELHAWVARDIDPDYKP